MRTKDLRLAYCVARRTHCRARARDRLDGSYFYFYRVEESGRFPSDLVGFSSRGKAHKFRENVCHVKWKSVWLNRLVSYTNFQSIHFFS